MVPIGFVSDHAAAEPSASGLLWPSLPRRVSASAAAELLGIRGRPTTATAAVVAASSVWVGGHALSPGSAAVAVRRRARAEAVDREAVRRTGGSGHAADSVGGGRSGLGSAQTDAGDPSSSPERLRRRTGSAHAVGDNDGARGQGRMGPVHPTALYGGCTQVLPRYARVGYS